MQNMRRAVFGFVLLIAVSIAGEPLLHTHPLSQTSPVPCAVCVSAVGRITAPAPAAVAPLIVVFLVTTVVPTTFVSHSAAPRASRAPPAA
jgi:hypothetical protein